ncbi:MAG: gamma-glutamyltransferase family protein [Kiloniellaceae bacterium]
MGYNHAITSGHYLATQAGFEILGAGGNAVDAGVATGIALGVLQSDIVNVAGVAPMIIWLAAQQKVVSIDGVGGWPKAVTPDFFMKHHKGEIPTGILRTVVPAAPAAWLTALERYGTMSFTDVAKAAIGFARDGFPMYPLMANHLADNAALYRQWDSNRAIYLPNGRPPRVGERFVQADLAASLQYMADEERAAARQGRDAGIAAARNAFYRGDIARKIAAYHQENGGLLTYDDLAGYEARLAPTVRAAFRDMTVHCCGPWTQGPALAQSLRLLEPFLADPPASNSPAWIHLVVEALKLAFADRERFYGDPDFVDVPLKSLLSDSYSADRRRAIDPEKAHPGVPPSGTAGSVGQAKPLRLAAAGEDPPAFDTSYVGVVDRWGNAISATPSDVSRNTPVIPGTGLCPSERGSQSRADPEHPASVAPGKRPRMTPNPAMAFRGGKPCFVFGSPGADVQVQAMLQVFLNVAVHGMDVQEAIETPRFATYSFPASFAPNSCFPDRLNLEPGIGSETSDSLARLGHKPEWWPEWVWRAGGVCAIQIDQNTGLLSAGADPRRPCLALCC